MQPQQQQQPQPLPVDKVDGPDVWAVRITFICIIFIGTMGMITTLVIPNDLYQKVVIISFQVLVIGILIPSVILLRNENMTNYSKSIIKAKVTSVMSIFHFFHTTCT